MTKSEAEENSELGIIWFSQAEMEGKVPRKEVGGKPEPILSYIKALDG